MTMRAGIGLVLLGVSTLAAIATSVAGAQESRLVGRLPDIARARVDSIIEAVRGEGLPTEPIVDRALEGAAKGASSELIVSAVTRLSGELRVAREAFGAMASSAEVTAGASAVRAGATREDLAQLRIRRAGQSLMVAAAVLADLVAVGVPADTAVAAVLALAKEAEDVDYAAFRRSVGRDIALGASPAAALGVRLRAATEMGGDVGSGVVTPPSGPQKRKP